MEKLKHPLDILHIEDNSDDAFFFRDHLHAVDIEVGRIVQLETLEAALGYLHDGGAPDIIFLDLSLPDAWELDGLDRLLQTDPSLIVIVLTGSGDRSLPLRALQAGAQDYMSKQELSAEMLARVIRFALYRSESREALLAASEEAKRANLAKSRFLANIGHELRTPLNVMMGYTDLFASEVELFPDAERKHVKEDLKAVSQAQEHLLDLLNDLIDMAKIESDQLRLEPSVFSLHQLIENVSHLFRESFSHNGNQFTYMTSDAVPELVYADPKRIRQLVINLVSNANKFTRNGLIGLSVACAKAADAGDDQRTLTIQVRDTGIGIAHEDQERIFEYFSQVDDSDRREFEGSGLGLTICRQLAHMMGGDIQVESERGEGSVFTVNMKVARAEYREPIANGEHRLDEQELEALADRKALVVEDDSTFRSFIAKTLKQMGLKVQAVGSAEEAALSLVGGSQFDFLFIDLHLPGKDGFDLIKAIKRSNGPIPRVILATGDQSAIVRERCEEEGIEEFMLKPFAADALCRRLIQPVEK